MIEGTKVKGFSSVFEYEQEMVVIVRKTSPELSEGSVLEGTMMFLLSMKNKKIAWCVVCSEFAADEAEARAFEVPTAFLDPYEAEPCFDQGSSSRLEQFLENQEFLYTFARKALLDYFKAFPDRCTESEFTFKDLFENQDLLYSIEHLGPNYTISVSAVDDAGEYSEAFDISAEFLFDINIRKFLLAQTGALECFPTEADLAKDERRRLYLALKEEFKDLD